MAVLVSIATGNLTAAATWSVVHTGTFQTLRATQETGTTALTTTLQASPNFTVSASTTVDSVLLKHNNSLAGTTATITVQIYNSSTATVVATMTTAAGANLPTAVSTPNWFQFKFASSVTLATGNNYQIRLSASVGSSNHIFYRKSGTAADWTFGLRTTTTAAPASGDFLIIAGEISNTARTNYTVTNNNTSSTLLLGNGTAGTSGVEISYDQTLKSGTSASTNYYLRINNDLTTNSGSKVYFGDSTTKIPATSTTTLELNQPAAARFSIVARSVANAVSTFHAYSDEIRRNYCILTAGLSAGATSATISSPYYASINWKNGDEIGIFSTDTDPNRVEYKTLSADESAGTITWTGGLTYAHTQYIDQQSTVSCTVANLTRNIKFIGTSTTLRTGTWTQGAFDNVYLDGVEFKFFGRTSVAQNTSGATSGTATFKNCVFKDGEGLYWATRVPRYLEITECNFSRVQSGFSIAAIGTATNYAGAVYSITKSVVIGGSGGVSGNGTVDLLIGNGSSDNPTFTITDLRINGLTASVDIVQITPVAAGYMNTTVTGLYVSSCDAGTNNLISFGISGSIDAPISLSNIYTVKGNSTVTGIESLGTNSNWSNVVIENVGNGIRIRAQSNETGPIMTQIKQRSISSGYFLIHEDSKFKATDCFLSPASAPPIFLKAATYSVNTAYDNLDIYLQYTTATAPGILVSIWPGITALYDADLNNRMGVNSKVYLSEDLTAFGGSKVEATYTRNGYITSDSVNYYQTSPSTVLSSGTIPISTQADGLRSPDKKFVLPANKTAIVSVWVYVTIGTGSSSTVLRVSGASDASTTTKGAWTQLSTTVTSTASDRFISATVINYDSGTTAQTIVCKISDWTVNIT